MKHQWVQPRPFTRPFWGVAFFLLCATTSFAQDEPAKPLDPLAKPAEPAATPEVQDPAEPKKAADEPAQGVGGAAQRDLASRFRFLELHKLTRSGDVPGLWQYEVAFRETLHITTEQPQAAPTVQEVKRGGRFTERAAELSADRRVVTSVVRQYDTAEATLNPPSATKLPKLAENLKVWVKDLGGAEPALISLTPGRGLLLQEYGFAMTTPYLPLMTYMLPEQYVRIGDSWTLTRTAAAALVGEAVASGGLTARLASVEPLSDSAWPGMTEKAVFEIEGRVKTARGNLAMRALVEFAFRERLANATPDAEKPAESVRTASGLDTAGSACQGGITKVRLAQVSTVDREKPGQPAIETRRELVLERRWPEDRVELKIDDPLPSATPENSWLTYRDPNNRFSFRYPPYYAFAPADLSDGGQQFVLLRGSAESQVPDRVELRIHFDKTVRLDSAFEADIQQFQQAGYEQLPGKEQTLPPGEWNNFEVQHIESALTPDETLQATGSRLSPRLHFDGYLMHLPRNISLTATGLTASDDASRFRGELESVLKSVQIDPQ